jgi:hypothetical protein
MYRGLLILMLCFVANSAIAQNYYHYRKDGTVPIGFYIDKVYDANKTILLNQPNNQHLSKANALPFAVEFYGVNYTHYKVSDNGYLTFDTISTTSYNPDSVLPTKSILAFATDFKLQKLPVPNDGIATQVYAYTVGQAPNRTHIVAYYGVSLAKDSFTGPISNSSIFAFALVFNENKPTQFDLIYTPYGNKNAPGKVGTVKDNNLSYLLGNGALTYPYQFSYNNEDLIVYHFEYGAAPKYDLAFKSIHVAKIYPQNAIVNFTGTFVNYGTEAIQKCRINYAINAADTVSYALSNLQLASNGEGKMNFTHPVSWTSGALGSLNQVNVWISEPNDSLDQVDSNNHYYQTVLRNANNTPFDRNILLEEATGAWCGYCPDAHLIVAEAKKTYGSRVIPVSYHFDDSMSNNDALWFLSQYISSYPDAQIDRKTFLGSNSTWLNAMAVRVNQPASVALSIEQKRFDPVSRTIQFRVKAQFEDYWYGNLRIGAIVTEDHVRGNANPNIWSQNNFYSKDNPNGAAGGSSHPLYNEANYMNGYYHESVQKANPGGVFGVDKTIPQLVAPGQTYYYDFAYNLPPTLKVAYQNQYQTPYCNTYCWPGGNDGMHVPANINLIGFVTDLGEDQFNSPILNAVAEPLWRLSDINAFDQKAKGLSVFPNPFATSCTIQLPETSKVGGKLTVYSVLGQSMYNQTISTTDTLLAFDWSDWPSGVYTIHYQQDQHLHQTTVVKQ